MAHFKNMERLVVLDADGTNIDAFQAIQLTFRRHGMDIGNLECFQKHRKLFKYLGGIREFPTNLRRQFGKQSRMQLLTTLTDVYCHGIDTAEFDYFACISLQESKIGYLKLTRQSFNPARGYSCWDEYSDYLAAIGAGTRPFVVAYGFEDSVCLSQKFCVPPEVISTSPEDFTGRLLYALDLPNQEMAPRQLALQESS